MKIEESMIVELSQLKVWHYLFDDDYEVIPVELEFTVKEKS